MNAKAITSVLTMAILTCLNTACSVDTVSSKEVSAQAVHQSLSATYEEASNSTRYNAQFRVGGWSGTTIHLDSPSKIEANGQVLSSTQFLGTSYSGGTRGAVSMTKFDWTSQDNKVYSNSIEMKPIAMVPPSVTLQKGQAYEVKLVGAALSGSEHIDARIEQSTTDANGQPQFIYVTGNVNASTLVVTFVSSEMQKLHSGSAKLTVSRNHSESLVSATREGGIISSYYQLRPVDLMIIESGLGSLSMAKQ